MLSTQALLSAMAEQSPDGGRWGGGRRLFGFLGLLIGLVGLGAALWVVAQAALYGWATADWHRFVPAIALPMPFLLLISYVLLYLFTKPIRSWVMTGALRETLAQGDVQVAPLAALQPAPLNEPPFADGPAEFHALRRMETRNESQRRMFPLLLWVLPIQFMGPLMELPQALGTERSWDWFDSPFFGLEPAVLFGLAIIGMVTFAVLMGGGPRNQWDLTANVEGLTWRRKGRGSSPHLAPWSSIRTFFKVAYRDASAGERTAFVVDAGDAVFGWVLGPNSKDEEFAESNHLSRLIVAQAGKPLRELAPALGRMGPRGFGERTPRAIALPESVAAEMAAAKKRVRRSLLRLIPIVLAIVVIAVIAFSAEGWLQSAQRSYFAGLAPQVYASRALFSDSLAYDDGLWPVTTPSATSEVGRVFAQGSYQVTGGSGTDGFATAALAQPVYGDAAVEVTVRSAGFGDIGVALRAQSDGNLIAFTVDQADGSWALVHYQYDTNGITGDAFTYLDTGASSAIQREVGAANHLLVVMRGDTYLLYANDHLLDVANQQYDDPKLTQGLVGVFVADPAVTGSFTNFAVYATPPETSVSWV